MGDEEGGWGGDGGGEDISHESGCGRLFNSIFVAVCLAPAAVLIAMFLLGWNERRAVCDQRAIAQGKEEVLMNDCESATANVGKLVMFQCDLREEGLPDLSVTGVFADLVPQGPVVGLEVHSEMFQCVEQKHSHTTKDSVGGGKTTTHTYTYSTEWRSSHVDTNSFAKRGSSNYQSNCGETNPAWPAELPQSSTEYVNSAMVGPYSLSKEWVETVPLDKTLNASSVPAGWVASGEYYTSRRGGRNNIGDVRIRFRGNDWSKKEMTALGKNSEGSMAKWTAPDSWMCSGFTLGALRQGSFDKNTLFKNLEAEANTMTYILRLVGFVFLWLGFCCFFKPLEVAADCIPCIGPYLGDSINSIVACVTCPLACGCASGVIGVVWVFMRPLVGIPLMIVFCVCMAGAIGFKVYAQQQKASKDSSSGPEPVVFGKW